MGIPGAIIGGGVALYFYARHRKQSFLVWADIAVPGVALAQAIGRWGNFFNQELYGKPSTLPWAIYIDPSHRVPGYEQFLHLPASIPIRVDLELAEYGDFCCLCRENIRAKLKDGDILLMYLIGYPIGRFFLEFVRLDSPRFGTINFNQTVMLVVALVSAFLLFWRHRKQDTPSEDIGTPRSLGW